jgi:hypothetical protein
MKKYLIFLLLIVVSCQPDDILLPMPEPIQEMIFDVEYSTIQDGQDIHFNSTSTEKHQLIIKNEVGSVITKETFNPTIGINVRTIYTKSLPKGILSLSLVTNSIEISKTNIIIE